MGGGGSQLGPDATGYDLYRQFIVNMHTFANVCEHLHSLGVSLPNAPLALVQKYRIHSTDVVRAISARRALAASWWHGKDSLLLPARRAGQLILLAKLKSQRV